MGLFKKAAQVPRAVRCGACSYGYTCVSCSAARNGPYPAPSAPATAASPKASTPPDPARAKIVPSLWHMETLNGYTDTDDSKRTEETDYYKANLIGSRRPDGKHEILLDLDGEHEYRPSSTPGHGHLVLKTKDGVDWDKFQRLLSLLVECGVIEQGYFELAVKRQQAFLRLPHIRKGYEKGHQAALDLLDLDKELADL